MASYLKHILKYGALVFFILIFFKVSELLFLNQIIQIEIFSSLLVTISIGIGFYYSRNFNKELKLQTYPSPLSIKKNNLLTKREIEVLNLMSKGFSNQEISVILHVSLNTTKTHLSNIYSKLGTKNRVQTVELARKNGLIIEWMIQIILLGDVSFE